MWCDKFWKYTFISTINKIVSQRTRFRNVYPNRILSTLRLLAPFSALTVIRKHSCYTQRITAVTLSNDQTPGKIHPQKCRGKEILRESSRITEGRRLRVQGHDLVISGLLYPLPICRPNSVQRVSGQGIMNGRSEYNLRCIGDAGEMRAGDCQLGTVKGNARETADSRVATKCGSPRARRRWQLGRESIQGHSAEEEEGGE
jgi:hypothetical protein